MLGWRPPKGTPMRRHVLTTKILAMALAASPACTKDVRPEPPIVSPAPVPSPVASAVAPIASTTPGVGTRGDDPALVKLREDLSKTKQSDALADIARFRPLCDKDGYPLVGNLAQKSQGLEPSQLCAEVRKKPAR